MGRLRVGLTGGIGSGKTTVADRLGRHGAVVIDSDLLAREVVAAGTPGLAAVADRFGRAVITAGGELDRPALGAIVFADPAARAELEAIVHPLVRQRAREIESDAPAGAVIIQVIPLLVETGQADDFDVLVVIDVDPATQRQRVIDRGLPPEGADRRIAAQAGREQRLAVADVVIDNSGDPAGTAAQVDALWADWQARGV